MDNISIKVDNLGKAYRIGLKESKHENLIGAVKAAIVKPLKNFKKISNLKKFDKSESADVFWANRNINFSVYNGEVLGIVGKNGAGKSTLLKLLSRITEPTEGRIEIHGKVASLLEVGTGFNPELTGTENIYLNGTILGLTRKEINDRYDQIVEFSGIEKFLETPVKRYSSGMKVRLAFAVAAHLDPEILIIDEVLAVGDAEFQKKCLGKMEEVAGREGRTVLFVSHDMAAVKKLCTRAILLEAGKIVKEGTPNEVVDFYLKNATGVELNDLQLASANRKGSGKFIVKSLQFLNENMEPVKVLETGMDLNISINYEMREKGANPVINFIVRNNLQQELVVFLSRDSHHGVLKLKPQGNVILKIPKMPLLPGRYTLDYNLKFDNEITDMVQSVAVLEVEKGDYFGTGKMIDGLKNGVAIYHTWQVN